MRKITLSLRSRDGLDQLAELIWSANHTEIVEAAEPLRSEVLALVIEDGLSEWVGLEQDPTPRTTPSSDPRFLERLAAYLHRQFRFVIELRDSEPVKRSDTMQWPRGGARSLREHVGVT